MYNHLYNMALNLNVAFLLSVSIILIVCRVGTKRALGHRLICSYRYAVVHMKCKQVFSYPGPIETPDKKAMK